MQIKLRAYDEHFICLRKGCNQLKALSQLCLRQADGEVRPAPLAGPCSTGRRELLAAAAVLLAAVQAPGRARADEPPVVALEGKPETGEAATVTTVPNTAGPDDTAVCTASSQHSRFQAFAYVQPQLQGAVQSSCLRCGTHTCKPLAVMLGRGRAELCASGGRAVSVQVRVPDRAAGTAAAGHPVAAAGALLIRCAADRGRSPGTAMQAACTACLLVCVVSSMQSMLNMIASSTIYSV